MDQHENARLSARINIRVKGEGGRGRTGVRLMWLRVAVAVS